jgi:filamentous hemagglutinin
MTKWNLFRRGRLGTPVSPATSRTPLRLALSRALLVLDLLPTLTCAQIVATPGAGTQVIETRNGLPQIDIATPSGAGVSLNSFQQFDVDRAGAILNNSPEIVSTQLGGVISGNPNLAPGQAARLIKKCKRQSASFTTAKMAFTLFLRDLNE